MARKFFESFEIESELREKIPQSDKPEWLRSFDRSRTDEVRKRMLSRRAQRSFSLALRK